MITPRIVYVFDLVFCGMLGLPYRLTDDEQLFSSSENPKIVYSNKRIGDTFWIENHGLLFEKGIKPQKTDLFSWQELPVFFKTTGDMPFDVFAATFFLVSRYEEYFGVERDAFGRFPAKNTLACKHGFLDKPIVNLWIRELALLLERNFPGLTFNKPVFWPLITFDIDVAYAYRGRPVKRNLLAAVKDVVSGNTSKLRERISCVQGRSRDPYDTYEYILSSLGGRNMQLLFFFLLAAKNNRYDRNLKTSNPQVKNLVERLSRDHEVGIHPSYYSSERPELLSSERRTLEQITNRSILKSRQHYLRFRMPDTFRALESAGITDDYSLGFAELPGFRAGICTPFLFYNLSDEKTSSLTLHPVTCMDGTFIEDMQLTPAEAISIIKKLADEVQGVGGEFVAIWHNHTVSNHGIYEGWRTVYEATIDYLTVIPT